MNVGPIIIYTCLSVGLMLCLGGVVLIARPQLVGVEQTRIRIGKFIDIETGLPGLVLVALGLVALLLGVEAYKNGGADLAVSETLQNHSVGGVLDQMQAMTLAAGEQEIVDTKGWVFLGSAQDSGEWSLDFRGKSIQPATLVRAQRKITMREDHFGGLTGTTLGRLFGVKEPTPIETLDKGSCVVLTGENRTVGMNKVWLEVKKSVCPKEE